MNIEIATRNVTVFTNTTQGGYLFGDYNSSLSDDSDDAYNKSVTYDARFARALLLNFVICGVLICSIGVMGIIGNALSLCILCRREMRSSINLYLSALGIYDTILIFTAILGFGIPSIPPYTGHLMGYLRIYPFMIRYIYPIALFAQTGSVWITVSVTIERYVAVVHPLKARLWCTMARAKIVIIALSFMALIYNIPRFFETAIIEIQDSTTNETYIQHAKSKLRDDDLYYEVYYVWLYLPFMNIIPFLALAILNSIILITVRRAKNARTHMSRHQEKEVNTAMMLVCIVAIFFVCNIMAVIINIIEHAGSFHVDDPVVVHVSNLLVTFNSSVNFAIYCIYGQKFRQLFLRIFCRRQSANRTHSRIYVMKSRTWHSVTDHNGSSFRNNSGSFRNFTENIELSGSVGTPTPLSGNLRSQGSNPINDPRSPYSSKRKEGGLKNGDLRHGKEEADSLLFHSKRV